MSRILCRFLSGGKTEFRTRKCPFEVPLTGGRSECKVGSGVVLRWSEMPPVGRPSRRCSTNALASLHEMADNSFWQN